MKVQGVTLQNSPMFHLVPSQCEDVEIDKVTILALADSPNTDVATRAHYRLLDRHR